MIATRLHQRLESDIIRIPNAAKYIGKQVEIIVLFDTPPENGVDKHSRTQILGSAKGQVQIAPDFDAPLPDSVLQSFEQ